MRYTFRQLEYFVAAGETESVTRASARMNISQTSISTAISHLERELGSPLFTRAHVQGLSLTPLGLVVLREAKSLLKQGESLHQLAAVTSARLLAAESGAGLLGRLNVGCLITLAPLVLPELTHGFRQIHSQSQVESVDLQQDAIVQGLRRGDIHTAITLGLQIPDDVLFTPLASLPLLVWLGESHPLAHAATLDFKDLAAANMIIHDVPCVVDHILARFKERGLDPSISNRSPYLETIRSLVANGCGYTLTSAHPRCDIALDGRRIIRKSLSSKPAPMRLGLVSLRAAISSPLQAAFEQYCKTLISDFYIPGLIAPALDRSQAPATRLTVSDRGPAIAPDFCNHDSPESYDRERHQ
jgi:DNA-binding transcriptional LysR family regulator